MVPVALVPPPMHGFGIPFVGGGGGGGLDVLQPAQIPLVVVPFPPEKPAVPVVPVSYTHLTLPTT